MKTQTRKKVVAYTAMGIVMGLFGFAFWMAGQVPQTVGPFVTVTGWIVTQAMRRIGG